MMRRGMVGLFVLGTWCLTWGGAQAAAKAWKPSPRQNFLAEQLDLQAWQSTGELSGLIQSPKGPGNAASIYSKLLQTYKAEYDAKTLKVPMNCKGLDLLRKATGMKFCRYIPDFRQPMTKVGALSEESIMFLAYSRAILKKSESLEKAGKIDDAEAWIQRLLIIGHHLVSDRPDYDLFRLGLVLQFKGAKAYAQFLTRNLDSIKARKLRRFAETVKRDLYRCDYKKRYLLESWQDFLSLAACIRCAEEDHERLWREQAVLNLWILQNGVPQENDRFLKDPAQQDAARKALERLSASATLPSIKKLAAWCLANRESAGKRREAK